MLFKEFQTKSLLDYLKELVPNFNNDLLQITVMRRPKVNEKAAKTLFALWRDKKNVIKKDLLKRPTTIALDEVNVMEREGLVKSHGDNLKITEKGANVIKTMILGDEKSSFEDDGSILDFKEAQANTIPKRIVKRAKVASSQLGGNWYRKLSNGNSNN